MAARVRACSFPAPPRHRPAWACRFLHPVTCRRTLSSFPRSLGPLGARIPPVLRSTLSRPNLNPYLKMLSSGEEAVRWAPEGGSGGSAGSRGVSVVLGIPRAPAGAASGTWWGLGTQPWPSVALPVPTGRRAAAHSRLAPLLRSEPPLAQIWRCCVSCRDPQPNEAEAFMNCLRVLGGTLHILRLITRFSFLFIMLIMSGGVLWESAEQGERESDLDTDGWTCDKGMTAFTPLSTRP